MISQIAYESDLTPSTSVRKGRRSRKKAAPRVLSAGIPTFVEEKIRIPAADDLIERPRLETLIVSSAQRFVANLISGRARTGKSSAAASVARRYQHAAWYTLDLTDNSWPIFAHHFAASVLRTTSKPCAVKEFSSEPETPSPEDVAHYLVRLLPYTYSSAECEPTLLVLDDIHHIYDAPWFSDLFGFLLHSLPPSVHLLLISRGAPPLPLWRLRSKQLLNVIDESLLAFDLDEAEKLCDRLGAAKDEAFTALEASFGRVGEMINRTSSRRPLQT